MKNMDKKHETQEELKNNENLQNEGFEEVEECNNCEENNELKLKGSIKSLENENKKLENELEALKDRLLRTNAEYENFRKRTVKEKEGIYTEACEDVLKNILPVIDNLERAVTIEGSAEDIKKGVEMTLKAFNDAFDKLNVEEIDTKGEFDPILHNAVMHVEDDSFGKNSIVETFQKGYKRGDKVLRYSMVKVAN
ncbi:nucleotide exchange factor GrpE [Clostridium sp.]|uniref:nucleotide exchange factor GrpE n=1 Tax=Clostridium sp. TaxID=1506 RepID=UPI003464E753